MRNNYQSIKLEKQGNAFFLTFNKTRNALDEDTLNELEKGLSEAELNRAIKVIVIQGAGEKVFAAGGRYKTIARKGTS